MAVGSTWPANEPPELAPLFRTQIDHDAALAAVVHLEGRVERQIAAQHLGEESGGIADARGFDLHHIGTPVGHDHAGRRAGDPDAHLNHPDPIHRFTGPGRAVS